MSLIRNHILINKSHYIFSENFSGGAPKSGNFALNPAAVTNITKSYSNDRLTVGMNGSFSGTFVPLTSNGIIPNNQNFVIQFDSFSSTTTPGTINETRLLKVKLNNTQLDECYFTAAGGYIVDGIWKVRRNNPVSNVFVSTDVTTWDNDTIRTMRYEWNPSLKRWRLGVWNGSAWVTPFSYTHPTQTLGGELITITVGEMLTNTGGSAYSLWVDNIYVTSQTYNTQYPPNFAY